MSRISAREGVDKASSYIDDNVEHDEYIVLIGDGKNVHSVNNCDAKSALSLVVSYINAMMQNGMIREEDLDEVAESFTKK